MGSQRRLLNLITMLILLTLIAVACERPLGGGDETTEGDQAGEVTDVNQGGGTDGDTTTAEGDTTSTDTQDGTTEDTAAEETTEATTTEDTATEMDETADTTDEEAGGGVGDATSEEQPVETEENAGEAEESSDEGTTEEESSADTGDETDDSQDESDGTIPATHTVVAGENLYRIGLKYGISWVAIANANNLTNPHVLTVGQQLTLPGGGDTTPAPTPTPSPQTETTYIVQPGDNLFRIGLKFGISWVQIAEANGLVNPNLIKVGDELKIPVDAPGPAPAFSHVVKQGETLFLISLQYGVTWPAIAEANDLTSPYVIYVGQTLEIPGTQ